LLGKKGYVVVVVVVLCILNDVYKKEQAHHMRIISLVAIGREGNDEINMNN